MHIGGDVPIHALIHDREGKLECWRTLIVEHLNGAHCIEGDDVLG
jgi:hypothetical protein